jgi:Fe-S cluster assembly protein SufD
MVRVDRSVAPVAAFAERFGEAFDRLPGSRSGHVAGWRRRSFESFRSLGLPTQRAELWKYTNLPKALNQPMQLAVKAQPPLDEVKRQVAGGTRARRLIFVNGHLAPELSHVGGLPAGIVVRSLGRMLEEQPERVMAAIEAGEGERSLTALNAAFLAAGAWIELADGAVLEEPIQLLFLTQGQPMPVLASPRNIVRLGRGASLRLIESHVALGDGHCFTNLVSRFDLAEGARLVHDRLELGKGRTSLVQDSELTLAAGAALTQTLVTLGGALVRNETRLRIDGAGVEAQLNGLYMPTGQEHVDNLIRVDHLAPGSHSDQFYKGVVDGKAHAVFAGKIVVHQPAQKTNAFQANNNLLLSDDAEIDTKPELEIYADDVKCSHGATVGDLDPRALFYLRSRGIGLDQARSLLTYAYAAEVVARLADPSVQKLARAAVLARLPGGAELGDP